MSLNDPRSASVTTVRKPRPYVTVDGKLLTGVIDFQVDNASHFNADTYTINLAANGLPADMNVDWWSSVETGKVAIAAAFEDENGVITRKTPLLTGNIDNIDYDPNGGMLTLTGRDLSALIIDTPTAEKFQNLTSSEIVAKIAEKHGLTANATATTTKAGTFYKRDNVVLTKDQSEWDLLVYLAQQEGFDLWVSGSVVNFVPSDALKSADPYTLLWVPATNGTKYANFTGMKLHRSVVLAQDVVVKVKSWHQASQASFQVQYPPIGAHKVHPKGKPQIYSYVRPNMTNDQALQFAKSRFEEITKHEMVLSANLPGDDLLTTRVPVRLVGTATAWDQLYFPESVSRRMSMSEGYRMDLRAKNHATMSTVNL